MGVLLLFFRETAGEWHKTRHLVFDPPCPLRLASVCLASMNAKVAKGWEAKRPWVLTHQDAKEEKGKQRGVGVSKCRGCKRPPCGGLTDR